MPTIEVVGGATSTLRTTAGGAPLVYPFTFRHKSLWEGKVVLPGAPIVIPRLSKTVVETPMAGSGEPVIEYVSKQAFRVNIRVIDDAPRAGSDAYLVNEIAPNLALIGQVMALADIEESIEVDNEYLAAYGITHLLIEEVEPEVTPGRPRVIFNLRCRADKPWQLLTD